MRQPCRPTSTEEASVGLSESAAERHREQPAERSRARHGHRQHIQQSRKVRERAQDGPEEAAADVGRPQLRPWATEPRLHKCATNPYFP